VPGEVLAQNQVFHFTNRVAYSGPVRLLRFARNDKSQVSLRGAERRSNPKGRWISHRIREADTTSETLAGNEKTLY